MVPLCFSYKKPSSALAPVPLFCKGVVLTRQFCQPCLNLNRHRSAAKTQASLEEKDGKGAASAVPAEEEAVQTALAAAAAPPPPLSRPTRSQVDKEIFSIALPTLATLAADPIASLVSTAWVGRLGSSELAAVGVALSVYNTITKLFNMPLLAVTTSTVASALGEEQGDAGEDVSIAVSAALMLAVLTGAVEAVLLGLFGVAGLGVWGAGPSSPLHSDAVGYLVVRALSTPATVLFLALQGVFRGLGDTSKPFAATLLCNIANMALEPLLIFKLGLGVRGAAGAIVVAQVLSCCMLLYLLDKRCKLRLAGRQALLATLPYLKPTGLLTLRTLCISSTFAVATGLAARTGAVHTAAHQVCFQVWLASSLLADSLAVAAQALLARTLGAGDKQTGKVVVERCLQLALCLGAALVAGLVCTSPFFPRLFTQDPAVLRVIALLLPAVVATQPLNAVAFLMDGVLYGVGGFHYAAQAMVVAVAPPLAIMLVGPLLVAGGADAQLLLVWAGMASLMLMRFLVIFLPYAKRLRPFDRLAD